MMRDGSNLPRVVALLNQSAPERFHEWVVHLQTIFHDLDTITSELRPEDKARYLTIRYKNGLTIPSWLASEGTLRVIGLTVLAYAPSTDGIYLIEEPENGIHPTAIEAVYQSLTSVYEGQVLVASHSPVLLSLAEPANILCFERSPEKGTSITPGDQHPKLKEWKGDPNISVLFAAGILGE
jgi:predicted ATPase